MHMLHFATADAADLFTPEGLEILRAEEKVLSDDRLEARVAIVEGGHFLVLTIPMLDNDPLFAELLVPAGEELDPRGSSHAVVLPVEDWRVDMQYDMSPPRISSGVSHYILGDDSEDGPDSHGLAQARVVNADSFLLHGVSEELRLVHEGEGLLKPRSMVAVYHAIGELAVRAVHERVIGPTKIELVRTQTVISF